MAHETKAQKAVYMILGTLFILAVCYPVWKNIYAMAYCAPQAGKWTPWTGTICYGDKQ